MEEIYKTSVNLPQSLVDALKEMAQKSGTSMADVLRKAISTEKFLNDTVEKGGKILIQENGTVRELLIGR